MHSSYVVFSVLNAFQVAIVLRSIQFLRLTVCAFDGDDEKDEEVLLGPLISTLLFFMLLDP